MWETEDQLMEKFVRDAQAVAVAPCISVCAYRDCILRDPVHRVEKPKIGRWRKFVDARQ